MEQRRLNPAIAALIVIVLVGIVTSIVLVVNAANQEEATQTSTQSTQQSSGSSTDTSNYKDGTYEATISYLTPGGPESIGVTVTIAGGQITSTELAQFAESHDAKHYQQVFANNYQDHVVGKSVNEVSLSRVAGASLTSNGFNNALEQIKSDASA